MSTSMDYADSLFVTGSLDRCHNSTTEFGNTSERIYNFRNSTLGDASRAVSCAQIEADRSAINSQCQVAVKGCGRHFRLDFFSLHRFRRGFRCASKGQTATASAQRRADSRRRHRCCQSRPTSVKRTQSTINFQQSSRRAALSGAAHKRAPIQQQQLTSATSLFCSFGRAAVEQPVRCVAIGACHSQSINNSVSMLQHWVPA